MTTSYPSAASTVRSLLGTTGSPELVLQRRYRAAPGEVLAACTDLERLSQWFGQVGGGPGPGGGPRNPPPPGGAVPTGWAGGRPRSATPSPPASGESRTPR